MKTVIPFQFIAYHLQTVPPGLRELMFFSEPQDTDAESAVNWYEQELLGWLFDNDRVRRLILRSLELREDATARLSVTDPFIEKRGTEAGDIDLLLFDDRAPDRAVAIECKRVKVKVESFEPETVTKLNGLEKGVREANKLFKLGFSKTYLAVLIVVDGRYRKEFGMLSRGATGQQFKSVYQFSNLTELHHSAGLTFIEVVQPSTLSIDEMGYVGVAGEKRAIPVDQREQITNKIMSLQR